MPLEKSTTLQAEHIQLLAHEFAEQKPPDSITQLEPIADFEELYTFTQTHPTPIEFSPHNPAWRLEAVAARTIEAVAIAAHEQLLDTGYTELARILLEHTEYLYTYSEGKPRPKLEAGSALALAGTLCASLPQATLWQLAGFGRVATPLTLISPKPTDSHLTLPLNTALSLANQRKLPILEGAVTAYNTVLAPNFIPINPYKLPLNAHDFFDTLNLDFPGMQAVKTALIADNISAAKSEYTAFRQTFLDAKIADKTFHLPKRSDTYTTAKNYLESLLHLSIHPTPALKATTEIGIAATLFPECRHSETLLLLALRRYHWINNAFFHTDGFHKDRTVSAQVEAITDFNRFLSFCGKHTAHVEFLKEAVEKQVKACIHLSQPDTQLPSCGASPNPNINLLEIRSIDNSSAHSNEIPYPDTTSHPLHETGWYVMRNNWTPDAQYLFLDTRPHGKTNAHNIISQLTLHAHAQELTTASIRLLDGKPVDESALHRRWIATPAFDWFEGWRALTPHAENSQTANIHHKRSLFYLKGEYFILHDLLLAQNTHTLEQVFSLNRQTSLHTSENTLTVWTQSPGKSTLFLGATATPELTLTLDADTATYRLNGESPLVLNTILFPMQPEANTHPTLTNLPVRTDADVLATGFTLQLHNTTDTFLISDDGLTEMSAADITFVGEYLYLRQAPTNPDVQFTMLNGRFLQVGSRVLVDLDEPRESYVH